MVPQPQPAAARPTPQPAPVRQPVPQPAAPAVQQPQQRLWLRSNKLCKLKKKHVMFLSQINEVQYIKHIKTWISLYLSFWFYVIYWYLITSRTKMTNSRVQLALGIQASQGGRLVSLVSLFKRPMQPVPSAPSGPSGPSAPSAAPSVGHSAAAPPAAGAPGGKICDFLCQTNLRNPNQKCIEKFQRPKDGIYQLMYKHVFGWLGWYHPSSNPWRGWSLQRLGAFALKARGATEMKGQMVNVIFKAWFFELVMMQNISFWWVFSLMFLEEGIFLACWLCSVFFGFPTLDTSQGIDSPIVLTELRLFDEGGVEALRLLPEIICVYGNKVTNQVPETLKFFRKMQQTQQANKPLVTCAARQLWVLPWPEDQRQSVCLRIASGNRNHIEKLPCSAIRWLTLTKLSLFCAQKNVETFRVPGSQSRQ